jgi:hypothetical protein
VRAGRRADHTGTGMQSHWACLREGAELDCGDPLRVRATVAHRHSRAIVGRPVTLQTVPATKPLSNSGFKKRRKKRGRLTCHEMVYSGTLQPSSKVLGDTLGMVKWVSAIGSGLPLYHIEYSSCPKLPQDVSSTTDSGAAFPMI